MSTNEYMSYLQTKYFAKLKREILETYLNVF